MKNKILIVDDDVNICELLRLYLQKEGYDTLISNDGGSTYDVVKIDTYENYVDHSRVRLFRRSRDSG